MTDTDLEDLQILILQLKAYTKRANRQDIFNHIYGKLEDFIYMRRKNSVESEELADAWIAKEDDCCGGGCCAEPPEVNTVVLPDDFPVDALMEAVKVSAFGAKKHGKLSYLDPDNPSMETLSNAKSMMHHVLEDANSPGVLDPDTNVMALGHVACRALQKMQQMLSASAKAQSSDQS